MTRKAFMNKLMEYLKNISKEEREDIERFYNEMFDEENISLNDEVPEHYENPKKIAFDIVGDNLEFQNENKGKNTNEKRKNSPVFGATVEFPFFKILSKISFFVPIISVLGVLFAISIVSLVVGVFMLPLGVLFFPTIYVKYMTVTIICFLVFILILSIVNMIYKYYRRKNKKKNSSFNSDYYNRNFGNVRVNLNYNDDKSYEDDFEEDDDFEFENRGERMRYFENVEKLVIDSNFIRVILLESDDNRVLIDSTNFKGEDDFTFKDGILTVESEMKKTKGVEVGKLNNITLEKLKIYIPNGLDLDVDINAGEFKASDIVFEDINVELNAGSVEFLDVKAENLIAELNAGEMSFKDVKVEELNAELNAGDLEITDVQANYLEMEINAGESTLKDVIVETGSVEVSMGELTGSILFKESLNVEVGMGKAELEVESPEEIRYYLDKSMGLANISRKFERVDRRRKANLTVEVEMGRVVIK